MYLEENDLDPTLSLNESPSEKEGKYSLPRRIVRSFLLASMKVPPKRKGNITDSVHDASGAIASMKVPPKRKGNSPARNLDHHRTKPQ